MPTHPMTNNPTDDELVERVSKALGGAPGYARAAVEAILPTLIEYRQQVQDLKDALSCAEHSIELYDEEVTAWREGRGDEFVANMKRMEAELDELADPLTKESRV